MTIVAAKAALPAVTPLLHDVAYADTDAGGIVYHARYIEMAERSRNHGLAALGLPVAEMKERFGALFVVCDVYALYRQAAFVGDRLSLSSGIVAVTPARAKWRTIIMRAADRICDVEVQLAAFDPVSRAPCLLPAGLLCLLEAAPRLPPTTRRPMMKTDLVN